MEENGKTVLIRTEEFAITHLSLAVCTFPLKSRDSGVAIAYPQTNQDTTTKFEQLLWSSLAL
jgi:hypothetical protein